MIKHEDISKDWEIWKKRVQVERSIKRLKKQLPEMECSKQLASIIKKLYKDLSFHHPYIIDRIKI